MDEEQIRGATVRVRGGVPFVSVSDCRRHLATVCGPVLEAHDAVVVVLEPEGTPVAVLARPDVAEVDVEEREVAGVRVRVREGVAFVKVSDCLQHLPAVCGPVLEEYGSVVVEKESSPVARLTHPDEAEAELAEEVF